MGGSRQPYIRRAQRVRRDASDRGSVDNTSRCRYERRDQENVSEQLGSGLAARRMPVAERDGNSPRIEIARLAWNRWYTSLVAAHQKSQT